MSAAFRTRLAVAALGVAAILGLPGTAAADPPPGCTTADMTGVMAGVSASLAVYLLGRPDVNAFFTDLQGLPKSEVAAATEVYLDANPGVRADLDGIRQPSRDFRARCNLPQRALTLPGL